MTEGRRYRDNGLGAHLKAVRERRGLSQVEVSYAGGLSETYYGKVEQGLRRPSPAVLLRLLEVLEARQTDRQQAFQLLVQQLVPPAARAYLDPPPNGVSLPPLQALSAAPEPVPISRPLRIRRLAYQRGWRRRVRALLLVATTWWGMQMGQPLAEGTTGPIICRDEGFCRLRRRAA